jgi:uncharacterized 2Fe-2S/4Fe-4S cluster protein (DUF4445 family)
VVPNLQAAFGADVLSRVSAALEGNERVLRQSAEESVAAALLAAASAGAVEPSAIRHVVVAANSAMAALLCGADVAGLASHPFVAPELPDQLSDGTAIHSHLARSAEVALVPPIASFVGGDALAASLAAGLVDVELPMLLVDIGTNAEIVLALPGRTFVASAAAGPAFEGAGLTSGGPATAGAIERVEVAADRVETHVVGGGRAAWFSGAGFVSAVAALLAAGHIAPSGAMIAEGPLRARFTTAQDGVVAVTLADQGVPPVYLTQLDVRALQLAKAAVRTGIEMVLRHAGVSASELEGVQVAGAFGAALDPTDLIALGVLPSNIKGRVRRVGNAALEGAAAMALDSGLVGVASGFREGATHVDLAGDPEFNAAFVLATDLSPYVS